MKPLKIAALLLLLAALGGCAGNTARLQAVRALSAESAKLGAFNELSQRFRDTYPREQPYLTPAADSRERQLDAARQAAYPDFIAIENGVVLYLRALGKLAGDEQFDLEDQVKAMKGAINAWPDSGLDDRHVNAYAGLGRLLARALTARYQDRAVEQMLNDGQDELRQLLDAMAALLRYYDKTHENEQRIVLGTLESEIPFVDNPREHLLAALAKAHQQAKVAEYRLIGRRFTLAENNLAALSQAHRSALQQWQPRADGTGRDNGAGPAGAKAAHHGGMPTTADAGNTASGTTAAAPSGAVVVLPAARQP
ncbi:hypothetical protein ACFOLJ_30655 [Rugamonas sp. CCM 8940]|uniref:hypothetical protein n=1 Tax=Rugamonas sp. CCM 8940 TaxID=2765359 RepID=UPI0018F558A5|nr:hypothetical protein [Rugamonas sp. CCM 8940]MBJ7309288.1 hypothetical protein [Rugamonas sp. CCM 8940]